MIKLEHGALYGDNKKESKSMSDKKPKRKIWLRRVDCNQHPRVTPPDGATVYFLVHGTVSLTFPALGSWLTEETVNDLISEGVEANISDILD